MDGEDSSGDLFRKSVGEAVFIEWDIPNFKPLLLTACLGDAAQSCDFRMRNATWNLAVTRDHDASLNILLRRCRSETEFHTITYQISLQINQEEIHRCLRITADFGEKTVSRTCDIGEKELLQGMRSDNLRVLLTVYPEDDGRTPQKISNDGAKSGITPIGGTDILISQIKGLFLNGESSDFVIKVGARKFPVHKAILSARSPVLSAMLHNNLSEKKNSTADIVDCEPDIFEQFLRYIYSGWIEALSWDNVTRLYTLGDKYDLEHLRRMCVRYMEGNLCIDAFCDVVRLAVRHNLSALIELVKEFFPRNVNAILITMQWQLLMKENSDICNELFLKFVANSKLVVQ